MIKLEKYSSEFEKKYSEKVLKIIKGNVSVADFLTECKKIIPNEIISFNSGDTANLDSRESRRTFCFPSVVFSLRPVFFT